MANSHPAKGVGADEINRFFDENSVSSAAWDLIRHRVVAPTFDVEPIGKAMRL